MSLNALIESYDPIDVEYRERFIKDCLPVPRKIDPKYMSFIPTVKKKEDNNAVQKL